LADFESDPSISASTYAHRVVSCCQIREARSLAYDAKNRIVFVADRWFVNAVYRVDLDAAPVTTVKLTLTDGNTKR
jgi:hypothetical protein